MNPTLQEQTDKKVIAYQKDEPVITNPAPRGLGDRFIDAVTSMATDKGLAPSIGRAFDARLPGHENPELSREERIALHRQRIAQTVKARREAEGLREESDPAWKIDGSFGGNLARFGADMAGGLIGDANPTYLLAPGSSAVGRIAAQGAINAGTDAASQTLDQDIGVQEGWDWGRSLLNFGMGAGFQTLGEMAGPVARLLTDRGPEPRPKVNSSEDYNTAIETMIKDGESLDDIIAFSQDNGYTINNPEAVRQALSGRPFRVDTEGSGVIPLPANENKGDLEIVGSARDSEAGRNNPILPENENPLPQGEQLKLASVLKVAMEEHERVNGVAPTTEQMKKMWEDIQLEYRYMKANNERPDELPVYGRSTGEPIPEAANEATIDRPTPPPSGADDLAWADYHAEDAAYQLMKADKAARRGKERNEATYRNTAEIAMRQAKRRNPAKYGDPDLKESAGYHRSQADYYQTKMDQRAARGDAAGVERYRLFRDSSRNLAKEYSTASLQEARPLKNKSEEDLLAEYETLTDPAEIQQYREEIYRRLKSDYNQNPVRGGEEAADPYNGSVNVRNLDGLTPEGEQALRELPLETDYRSNAETDVRAGDVPPGDLPQVGDIAAINRAGQLRVTEAANSLIGRAREVGIDSDDWKNSVLEFLNIAEQHNTNVGETGRGLQILRNRNGGLNKNELKNFEELVSSPEKRKRLEKLIDQHKDDPEALKKIAQNAKAPRAEDYLFSAWYNVGLLSNPVTHVRNVIDTTTNIMADVTSTGLAAVIGKTRASLGIGDRTDRVLGAELGERIKGLLEGAQVAFTAVAREGEEKGISPVRRAFQEGAPLDNVERSELNIGGAGTEGEASPLLFKGKLGFLEGSRKVMSATDEFFNNVASISNLRGLATREAAKEGLEGRAMIDRANELFYNPTPDMLEKTTEYSRRMRYQDSPSKLGALMERARTADSKTGRIGAAAVRLNLPFVRTPDSIFRTALRYSPLSGLESVTKNDWKAGGARRDQAIARTAIGTATTALIANLAMNGDISGLGPIDYRQRQQMEATGWQPQSIKLGDKWISYRTLGPIGTALSVVATGIERADEGGDKDRWGKTVATTAVGMADALMSTTWTEGLANLFELFSSDGDAETKFGNYFAGLASSLTTPAILRQINNTMIDETVRSTTGDRSISDRVAGRIQAGIPGLSDNLPARHDVFGREVTRPSGIFNFLNPYPGRPVDTDPVILETIRLIPGGGKDGKAATIVGAPSRNFKLDGIDIKLTEPEYQQYQQISGTKVYQYIEELMQDPAWNEISDADKRDEIKLAVKDARKEARDEMFPPDPE